ncbi:hypothetical protein QFC19_004215 [Naganishia cerealis]|uniref:Uncharacterized protein n=1 Tax=Naganishia cerealis TaxID=610337 RepID=A0ACC2VX27_9TREE|nr:hypothetical protein QFC19_004215 [Naganishia cerealis]
MNLVEKPGEAMYVQEDGLHAWLDGQIIELMANSGNVLNAAFIEGGEKDDLEIFIDAMRCDPRPAESYKIEKSRWTLSKGAGASVYQKECPIDVNRETIASCISKLDGAPRSIIISVLAILATDFNMRMHINKAFQFTKQGPLSASLEPVERPVPEPQPDQVVVKILAAALNPVDVQLSSSSDKILGMMDVQPASPSNPKVPGMDFSGTIHAVGSNIDSSRFKIGDEVFGLALDVMGNGTLQQYLAMTPAPADDSAHSHVVLKKPSQLTHVQAAALPLVYSTIYTGFVHHGHLTYPSEATHNQQQPTSQPPENRHSNGKSVLVLGGSGGTGTMAIQFAKQIPEVNGRIVTTCSAKNASFVKSLGAAEVRSFQIFRRALTRALLLATALITYLHVKVIDYTTQDVLEAALNSQYAPFDLVYDCVGGADLISHLDKLLVNDAEDPKRGVYVTIVGDKTGRDSMGGPITNDLNPVQKERQRYVCMMLEASTIQFETMYTFLERDGQVLIDSTFGLKDAAKAYARLESARAVGKVVVDFEK